MTADFRALCAELCLRARAELLAIATELENNAN